MQRTTSTVRRRALVVLIAALASACSKLAPSPIQSGPRLESASAAHIEVLVGTGGGPGNLDGRGRAARFDFPGQIAFMPDGSLLIMDRGGRALRRMTPDLNVSTIMSSGVSASDVLAQNDGSVLIVDPVKHALYRIQLDDPCLQLAAGTPGTSGHLDGVADQARFALPLSVAQSGAEVLILDQGGRAIRRLTSDGRVSTLTVEALNADRELEFEDIDVDGEGIIWAASETTSQIFAIGKDGQTLAVFGQDGRTVDSHPATLRDGPPQLARFNEPQALSAQSRGVIVADTGNAAIRRIESNQVTTLHASPCPLYRDCEDDAEQKVRPWLKAPAGIAVSRDGRVLVSDRSADAVFAVQQDTTLELVAGLPEDWTQLSGAERESRASECDQLIPAPRSRILCLSLPGIYELERDARLVPLVLARDLWAPLRSLLDPEVVDHEHPESLLPADMLPEVERLRSMAVDRQGRWFFALADSHVVAMFDPRHPQAGVRIHAGQFGQPGYLDGPSAQALFHSPAALVVNAAGELIVADTGNHVLRRIAADGRVGTFAGIVGRNGDDDGAQGRLDNPGTLAVLPDGDLLVGDALGVRIRRVSPSGAISTFGAVCRQAPCPRGQRCCPCSPRIAALAADAWGNAWYIDSSHFGVWRMDPQGRSRRVVGTPAIWGLRGERLPGAVPYLRSLTFDASGNLVLGANSASVLRVRTSAISQFLSSPPEPSAVDGTRRARAACGPVGALQ